ncbi:FG-GAP-like repeat-containing protein [Streptomyces sp. NPDC002285]
MDVLLRHGRSPRGRGLVGILVMGMLAGGSVTAASAPTDAAGVQSLPGSAYRHVAEPSGVLTGDFNNDGKSDIALVGVPGLTSAPVAFSSGDGNWSITGGDVGTGFGAWANMPGVTRLAGDFNNDGKSDIALVGGQDWWTAPIAYSLGNGAWSIRNENVGTGFGAWASEPGVTPLTGDFNNDGNTDIALVGVPGMTTMPIAYAHDDGTWGVRAEDIGIGYGDWASDPHTTPLTGDFNNDGNTDIALVGVPGLTTVPIAFSHDDGTWSVTGGDVDAGFTFGASDPRTTPLTGDFNNDGNTDVALAGVPGYTTMPIALSDGDGTFTLTNGDIGTGYGAWAAEPAATPLAGDFNNDGNTDVALVGVPDLTTIPVAFSTGNGTWAVHAHPVGSFPAWARTTGAKPLTGDFNNDGKSDIALAGARGWTSAPIAFSNGDGTFAPFNRTVGTEFGAWATDASTAWIRQNTETDRFIRNVTTPYQIVRIAADVQLDLSGLNNILVSTGVHIVGDRTESLRPKLYTRTNPKSLLKIGSEYDGPSDGVRISGIRLDGGHTSMGEADGPRPHGISVESSRNVEIEKSDIYGWWGAGVAVADNLNRIDRDHTSWMPRIHDNYFHHNQSQTGDVFGGGNANGYGVVVSNGAYATIEKNRFNYNRHATAGDGSLHSGYLAYDNFVDINGGWNTDIYHTHMIDMHGSGDCSSHNCGPGGEYMDIAYNYIAYTAGTGIKLRGTPQTSDDGPVGMKVHHNLFRHSEQWSDGWYDNAAMGQLYTGLEASFNTYGASWGKFLNTPCDADRDGSREVFHLNGVHWWYGEDDQWTFVRRSSSIASLTGVADYNGDGRCDAKASTTVYITPSL